MGNNFYLTIGKLFFGVAILSIGIVHLVTGNFPTGLIPVAALFPGKIFLVYLSGIALIIAGLLTLTKKYAYPGACLAAIIWLVWLLALHLPQLIITYNKPGEWTPTFEVAAFFGGALILMGNFNTALNTRFKLKPIGRYIFALGLIVFFVLHVIYAQYIATLIPSWIPERLFWAYFVGFAFLAVAISIFIGKLVHLSTTLIALMFLIWFTILHLPRVVANMHTEPEWTSMFVVLGFSGMAFLIAAPANNKPKYG
jgi:uncharacterized membrane protein